MNLLLDLGNSRCKFAILEKDVVKKYGIKQYYKENRHSVIEALLHEYINLNKAIVSSVFDEKFNQQLIMILNSHKINDCYLLDPATESFGIQLAYLDPSQLGADRLAALIAANEKYSGNKCIIDCGTAITIDALDMNGMHRGGVILPSLASMQKALSVDTNIEYNESGGRFNIFANTTQDAIYTGCLSAVIGGIQHVVNTMQAHYDTFDQIIITGGDAEHIMSMLAHRTVHNEKLVLDGLMIVSRSL